MQTSISVFAIGWALINRLSICLCSITAMRWLIFCNSDGKVPEEVANELPNGSQVIPDKNSRTHCDRLTEAGSKSTHYSAPQRENSICGAEKWRRWKWRGMIILFRFPLFRHLTIESLMNAFFEVCSAQCTAVCRVHDWITE